MYINCLIIHLNMSSSKQLKYDKAYLKMALEWGKLSHCKRKQVGALIVKDGFALPSRCKMLMYKS